MKRQRAVDRPHFYLHKAPCGCKFWAVRRPKRMGGKTYADVCAAIDLARAWNQAGHLGARPCEHHYYKLRK